MTLDEFLNVKSTEECVISHEGFTYLVVCWDDTLTPGRLVILDVQAKNPGHGAFTRLVEFILQEEIDLYVSCVITERFSLGLERLGFERLEGQMFGANYLLANCSH